MQNDDPSPVTYSPEMSLIQTESPRVLFSKAKNNNFIAKIVKSKAFVPDIGKYEIEKGLRRTTKGFA